jgi:GNAT superfamily N-acetyltransferase
MTPRIQIASNSDDIARCFEVMHELRPHLTLESFLAQAARQQTQGWRLAFLESDGVVRSVTGYRLLENLAWGRFLYVDDLVTRDVDLGGGFGSRLLDWLVDEAKRQGCDQFHLDSGVQRFGAHRFYLHKGMDITSHHFAMRLGV